MRKVFLLAALLLAAVVASAQTYVGTLRVENRSTKDVWVKMTTQGDTATLLLYRVEISSLTNGPVNLVIPDIRVTKGEMQRTHLQCLNIDPLIAGAPVKEYRVKRLSGAVAASTLSFSCIMDGKRVTFQGVINRRAE